MGSVSLSVTFSIFTYFHFTWRSVAFGGSFGALTVARRFFIEVYLLAEYELHSMFWFSGMGGLGLVGLGLVLACGDYGD